MNAEKIIQEKLTKIEQTQGVRILYACESGSRAWNFASKDSDYDVRFIYVRDLAWYLSIYEGRDVIEEPILDEFDINGWDLQKFLKLAYKSNVVVFEWLKSPIIYRKAAGWEAVNALCFEYFSVKASLYHYFNIARNQHRLYLAPPEIKFKKFFYALRPLLFFFYIQTHQKPAPMDFLELLDFAKCEGFVPSEVFSHIKALYKLKIQGKEADKTEADFDANVLLAWIDERLRACDSEIKRFANERTKSDTKPLDKLFCKAVCGGL